MGLRELVLGGPLGRKDALGAKCARIDSLGLARRRLAKGKEEELVVEEPDDEAPAASAEEVVLKPGDDATLQEDGDLDSEAELKTPLANRHLNDSLRLARRRLRASIDIGATARSGAGPSNLANAGLQRASWSSSGTPQAAADASEHTVAAGAASSLADNGRQRSSSPSHHRHAASHHVRFRRASDGEYLNRRRKSSDISRAPGAVGAAAAAVGRLFRKLTANLGAEPNGHRPRSATPSRGGSPARSRRSSGHGPAGCGSHHGDRDRTQSASSQRRRRSSDNGVDPSSPPPAASSASASASTSSRRNKRASAPGEMFFSVGGGGGAMEAPSPPLGTRPGSAVAAARDSITKGKNWLARLSRGLTTGSGGSGGAAGSAAGGPPRPATAHPAGGGGCGGAVSSPLPPLPAGAVAAVEAPKSPHHHSGPVSRAFGLFARRSDPPAPAPAAAGCPDSGNASKELSHQTARSGPAAGAAAAALADEDEDVDVLPASAPAPAESAPTAAATHSVPAPVDNEPAPASVPLPAVA